MKTLNFLQHWILYLLFNASVFYSSASVTLEHFVNKKKRATTKPYGSATLIKFRHNVQNHVSIQFVNIKIFIVYLGLPNKGKKSKPERKKQVLTTIRNNHVGQKIDFQRNDPMNRVSPKTITKKGEIQIRQD